MEQKDYILVFPWLVPVGLTDIMAIRVNKLTFYQNAEVEHLINERTITHFLRHIEIFGATVYPKKPERGCIALNGKPILNPGEVPVSRIHYKNEVIYCIR